jgi:multiple sugar transport system substrate-binding protein
MARITRRKLLKLSSASAITARTGGLAAILTLGRAPAYAQGITLHWLRWNDFVPASDEILRKQIAPECQKALGIKLNIETINANDIQARTTSSIQSATGPDIICALGNWPQLYAESIVDVSDLAEEIGNAQADFYEESRVVANDGKKWIALPWCLIAAMLVYRKSWFEEIGYPAGKFPETWEEYRAAGRKLKAMGRPLGQTLGHTFGDAPAYAYPFTWSWGGKEVEADSKTVVLNSKETVESVKFAVAFWNDCYDPGGLAWDDSSNNRAFLAGTVSSTNNGASIYLEAKKKPDSYLTEKGTPLKDDIFHTRLLKGPDGQFSFPFPFSDMVMGYSKNQTGAKNFLGWVHSKPIFEQWFISQQGFTLGPTNEWQNHPLWQKDPIMLPFRSLAEIGRAAGYAGPANRAAAEVVTKYIITDMYAKAVQGMSAEDAVKWAHGELDKIYT